VLRRIVVLAGTETKLGEKIYLLSHVYV